MTWLCMACGRVKFQRPSGHWCVANYRNSGDWKPISRCLKNNHTSGMVFDNLPDDGEASAFARALVPHIRPPHRNSE